jgi:hypothetical protein
MAASGIDKIELRLVKPLQNGEAHEFTLSLDPEIRLFELTDYMRKEWKVLSERQVFYTTSSDDRSQLSDQLTLGQISQGSQSVTLMVIDSGSLEGTSNKKCCSIF